MSLSKINVIIKDKLHMDKGIKETFPIKPMVLFGSARKLKDSSMKENLVHSVATKDAAKYVFV